ncbi:hypothetical protein D3C73_1553330 [compost metagenome]
MVRLLDHLFGPGIGAFLACVYAGRHGDADLLAARGEEMFLDLLPYPFAHEVRLLGVRLGKHETKLLPAVTADRIGAPDR